MSFRGADYIEVLLNLRDAMDQNKTSEHYEQYIARAEKAERKHRELEIDNEQLRNDLHNMKQQLDAHRNTVKMKQDMESELHSKRILNAALDENRFVSSLSSDPLRYARTHGNYNMAKRDSKLNVIVPLEKLRFYMRPQDLNNVIPGQRGHRGTELHKVPAGLIPLVVNQLKEYPILPCISPAQCHAEEPHLFDPSKTETLSTDHSDETVLDLGDVRTFHLETNKPSAEDPKTSVYKRDRFNGLYCLNSDVTLLNSQCIIPGCIPPLIVETSKHQDAFAYLSGRISSLRYPDAIVHCLGLRFNLHEPYLWKSKMLTEMFLMGKPEMDGTDLTSNVRNHMRCSDIPPVNLYLEILEPQITPLVMAIAFGNLYRERVEIMMESLGGVLLAADLLGFKQLEEGCAVLMVGNVTWETVSYFYSAAVKCSRKDIEFACLAWLDLNLVPKLAYRVKLGQLPIDCLIRVLKSPRLFTYDEFTLYKVSVFWLFLQLNPHIEKMPSYVTVMEYFDSFPKVCSALEREEGHPFMEVFCTLRLHGIIDMEQVEDLYMMNVLPQSWVLKILAGNYKSLNSGGDMTSLINFEMHAIRRGFIILTDQKSYEHSEIVAIFGFFFELKSIRCKVKGSYDFWIQRLKPTDPLLTIRDCEHETFSKRSDRDVMYSISVQHYDDRQDVVIKDSERQTQRFGLGHKTSCGTVFRWIGLKEPLFVTFSLYMPPS